MNLQNEKCVMVIDENLPLALLLILPLSWELLLEKKCRKL